MSKKALSKLDTYLSETRTDDEMIEFVHDLAYASDPTDRTIASRYSLLKKHVRDGYPQFADKTLRLLAPPTELTQSIITKDREVRNAKTDIAFDQELVDKILALKTSSNIFERFVYLQFVSGRRISEIFDSVVKAAQKKPGTVRMTLSKKKDEDKFFNVELMDDIESSEFRKMLSAARKTITGMSLSDFTNRVNRAVRSAVRKDLSSHNLRGLYAVYRYHTDNAEKQNLVGFISRVLNHGATSESGVNYSNYDFQVE
jgi:hypothetical protein